MFSLRSEFLIVVFHIKTIKHSLVYSFKVFLFLRAQPVYGTFKLTYTYKTNIKISRLTNKTPKVYFCITNKPLVKQTCCRSDKYNILKYCTARNVQITELAVANPSEQISESDI